MLFSTTHAIHLPLLAMSLVALAATAAVAKSPAEDKFQAAVFRDGDESLSYRLLAPLNYDAKKKYPVVLFLHGAGERARITSPSCSTSWRFSPRRRTARNIPASSLRRSAQPTGNGTTSIGSPRTTPCPKSPRSRWPWR